MTLSVGSLFAGVGGFDLGLDAAGFDVRWQVEWDRDCRAVLARHWPAAARYGDVRDVTGADLEQVDVVTFGSPCQDLSVAGKRAGLDGERSGLFHEAIRIIKELRDAGRCPTWAVWENVAGALSSNHGRDFARVLDLLADAGAVVVEWAVLDARWFGVPQRRRRVFVVAGFDPRAERVDPLLPVAARVPRDLAARREAGQDVAGTLGGGSGRRGWAPDTDRMTFIPALLARDHKGANSDGNTLVPVAYGVAENQRGEVTLTDGYLRQITTGGGKPGQGYPAVLVGRDVAPVDDEAVPELVPHVDDVAAGAELDDVVGASGERELVGVGDGLGDGDGVSPGTVDSLGHVSQCPRPATEVEGPIAYPLAMRGRSDGAELEMGEPDIYNALRAGDGGSSRANTVLTPDLAVRRLTPRECERLMGWPDDHTRWRADGTEVSDSVRYRMCGNGVAAPVAAWIGRALLDATATMRQEGIVRVS